MGIYLGQLPPAEVARFKAELAETIIANFCYPRFFDHRTGSLQTRPIDRAKRQEVWLYLSSVDFTAWSRVDLLSVDFPHRIERLFIQFVQRNRSFFGAQGRRRMLDIRLAIGTCAGSVAQRLRTHLRGQPITPPFGSPRQVLSWTVTPISGRPEPTWEQIMPSTMELQRQLQEWRGEVWIADDVAEESVPSASKAAQTSRPSVAETPVPVLNSPSVSNGQGSYPSRPQQMPGNPMTPAASFDYPIVMAQQPTVPTPPVTAYPSQPLAQPGQYNRGNVVPASNPAASSTASVSPATPNSIKATVQSPSGSLPVSPVVPRRPSGKLAQSAGQNVSARQSEGGKLFKIATSPTPVVTVASPARPSGPPVPSVEPLPAPTSPARPVEGQRIRTSAPPDTMLPAPTGSHPVRPAPNSAVGFSGSSAPANNAGQREVFTVGEDDIAIFEQMRSQLMVWLRVEAIRAGLEVSGQGPAQLLEMLRQQVRYDETRLQVVSTLLNLASQVIRTGVVGVLDYKQALTFHLMHTKRL
jgi:hypothetical protein